MVQSQCDEVLNIADKYQVSDIRVFGSVPRGCQDEASGIDHLVQPGPCFSLFLHSDLMHELQDLLGVQVHVMSDRALISCVPAPRNALYFMQNNVPYLLTLTHLSIL